MSARFRRWAALALVPAALSACTLVQLRSETRELESASVLMGRVSAAPQWNGPVIVAATAIVDERVVTAHQVWLHEPGAYELLVPAGVYTVLAYGDTDGNGRPDAGDPAGLVAVPVEANGRHMIEGLDIALSTAMAAAVRRKLPPHAAQPPAHSTQVGALADLEAEAFSAEAGRKNYWTPLEAFRTTGGNIYFLEPFDRERVPVLFVHGAAGSAQDWRYFFEHLDRRRYQPWFFQYPSGAPLDAMAHLLHWKLYNLKLRYPVERLHVVAHSMGGLVVQRFLEEHAEHLPLVDQFITLSTPWDGEPRATLGVKYSPAVVPSWRDLEPEGSFLRTLFVRPSPEGVDHALLFAHRGGPSLLRPTSDGTVTISSQLRAEAQQRARVVMGFDEDHSSMLSSPHVLRTVARLLDGQIEEGA